MLKHEKAIAIQRVVVFVMGNVCPATSNENRLQGSYA
jgi:hypothetical protein